MESNKTIRVQVAGLVEASKSFGVLVDLIFDEHGHNTSASRLEWFPKSLCQLEKISMEGFIPIYFLEAPEWLLKEKNVKY